MTLADRIGKATDRFYDRMRSGQAATVAETPPTGSLDDLRGKKYAVVVSYRMSGQPIPSPVWFGIANGKLYFETGADSFKVKRIRRNADVLVAPATVRGRPTGPPFRGKARVVDAGEHAHAERIVQSNYGVGRRLYTVMSGSFTNAYVEVTPA